MMNFEDRRILQSLNQSDFIIIIVKNLFFFKKNQHFHFHIVLKDEEGDNGQNLFYWEKIDRFQDGSQG